MTCTCAKNVFPELGGMTIRNVLCPEHGDPRDTNVFQFPEPRTIFKVKIQGSVRARDHEEALRVVEVALDAAGIDFVSVDVTPPMVK